jgi:hypothetical protein
MVGAMRRWPLLRNRDYMLLWSGEVLSELGSQTSAVAYPLLILALTGSPAKAGVVGLAKWLPPALFAVPAGALAGHVDRKRLMIACDAIRLVAAASVVTMLILGRPPYAQIIAVAFIDGALFITSYICERGALRQVVPSDQIQDGVAQNEARTFAASIIGPPRVLIVGQTWLMVALVLTLLLAQSPVLIGLLVAAAEFATPVTNSVVAGSRVVAAPDHLQGRVQAAATMVTMSLAWLGPLAIGLAFQHTGSSVTILILAGWTLAMATIATLAPALRVVLPGPPDAAAETER